MTRLALAMVVACGCGGSPDVAPVADPTPDAAPDAPLAAPDAGQDVGAPEAPPDAPGGQDAAGEADVGTAACVAVDMGGAPGPCQPDAQYGHGTPWRCAYGPGQSVQVPPASSGCWLGPTELDWYWDCCTDAGAP